MTSKDKYKDIILGSVPHMSSIGITRVLLNLKVLDMENIHDVTRFNTLLTIQLTKIYNERKN